MKRFWSLVLVAALSFPSVAHAQKTKDNVYALCTVRDVAVKDDQMVGTIYRSAVFSAPASHDSDISMTPEKGGNVSRMFEQFLWKSRGLSAQRMSISNGDEHYCIEAPLTLEGKDQLEKMTRDWDRAKFPNVEMIATGWRPPATEADKRFDASLAEYEKTLAETRAAQARYREEVARVEAQNARAAEAARAAQEAFTRDRAAYEAAQAAAAAETERRRQAYREEYRRVTGRYPDE